MVQLPATDSFLLKWRGDSLTVELRLDAPRAGRAAFRTDIGGEWTDLAMDEVSFGVFRAVISLESVGVFSGKACFFPMGSTVPEWPSGGNLRIKVESAETYRRNSIYCVFPRQFGSFREVVRKLPHIMDRMGFRIIQTLPPFPVPTTYAVMGKYGCPFAATDFLSVDPAMAEFDEFVTPLGQFKELIGAVHARGGLFFVDLPANHTGWGSVLQTHHPEWFRREADGRFHSPGAWGVKWSDLVELDYAQPGLREYMADVFLYWCRIGVDGFRCDAGYMIPSEVWSYIVAHVREEYPDTVFLLEGLGGSLDVTDQLLKDANLDWAYSELFQTYDRREFEWYLPGAIERAERFGALVHFAETHDNDRLAKRGKTYARLRVQLAALLSWQGAWGIANGVEWFATEKIDVHDKNDLNWGAADNMVDLIAKLNSILSTNELFAGECHLKLITRGPGNVLAVLRRRQGCAPALVVANLDCETPNVVGWDVREFAPGEVVDLVSGKNLKVEDALRLAPGEVKCLQQLVVPEGEKSIKLGAANPSNAQIYAHVEMPRDHRRDIVVPHGELVEVKSADVFRLRLVDPTSGRTVFVGRSVDGRVMFCSPDYLGDGTACRMFNLEITYYREGRAIRESTRFFVSPPADLARVKMAFTGGEIASHSNYRAILSNGAGAASQLRLGWATIESQYDAILAANPNPTVPSDRLVIWTRTRCWLQREGYTREFDAKCTLRFETDPAGHFARWHFRVPCGLGKETDFKFELSLASGQNAARLRVCREETPNNDVGERVRIVFRPDLEWRSFHSTTKAYEGAEKLFPEKCRAGANCVSFAPYGDTFSLHINNGAYHHESEWKYAIAHREEALRGQDGSGDLFSPGWFSADLFAGESTEIIGYLGEPVAFAWPEVPSQVAALVPLDKMLNAALDLYIVRRDDLKTVIAGYPWFLDWGRDTFIFMRGMIAAGRREDALAILRAFAAFEENGTLPNIINGRTAANRDTTDAQLWFIRCVEELGAMHYPELRRACESIVENYLKGTPNGIRVDPESALVWSPSHFTWMDTNYPACTPRIGYPVEIEALWIAALRALGRVELAERALASVKQYFRRADGLGYADCLDAPNGESAALAKMDMAIRPNQLFLITLGVLDDRSILRATERLLVPGGIRSLDSEDSRYRGTYAGDEDTCRKPAYHNGTVWAWPFPQFAEAMVMTGAASSSSARSLLASAVDNINSGAIGHISEIADGDSPHRQGGCAAQAWSDSELLRVWQFLI